MTTVERAFHEHHEGIYAQALRAVMNVHDAEDIRSEVYKKMQRLESAQYHEDRKASFKTWVFRITNHVILDFFRTNKQGHVTAVSDYADDNDNEKSYFDFIAPESSQADSMVLGSDIKNSVNAAIDGLKIHYRRVAILYFLWDLPYNEIAVILNVPMGTVKGLLNRSRQKLQEALHDVYKLKPVKAELSEV